MVRERESTNGVPKPPLHDLLSAVGRKIHKETRGLVPRFSVAQKALAEIGIEQGWWTDEEVYVEAPNLRPPLEYINVGGYEYRQEKGRHIITPEGKTVYLTKLEFKVFMEFMRHPNEQRTFAQLLNNLDYPVDLLHTTYLRTYISYLRGKFGDIPNSTGKHRIFTAIPSVGYIFNVDIEPHASTLPQS